jgi:dienelactone hydrolase
VKYLAVTLLGLVTIQAQEPRFIQWTNGIAAGQFNQRTDAIAAIQTVASAEARKTAVRAKILELIGGLPQSNAPLNAQITGSIDMGSYSIQKILFESTPGLMVSTLLYLPKTSGPHPAVLFQIGHFGGGKSYDQIIPGNLAMKGFVVLAFDPIGEGERIQDYDPTTGTGVAGPDVFQHIIAGGQSLLLGQNFARYEIFDAQRAIDYLVSRPDVDATRIGATGCSGGGTLTLYLAALDPRIKVAAAACVVESFQGTYPLNAVGDSEQSFANFLSSGLDEMDYIELFAPQPYLILTTSADPLIAMSATQIVYDEASKWYSLYGAADRIKWVVGPGGHGTPVELRQAIYGWMIQWLNNNVGDSTEQAVTTLPDSQLRASSTGQVGGLQIYQVIRSTTRTPGSRDDLTAFLNQVVAHPMQTPSITVNSQTDNGTYKTQSISFSTEPGLTS